MHGGRAASDPSAPPRRPADAEAPGEPIPPPGPLSGMRMSQLSLRPLRDDPADAEVDSHRLLVRAGFLRRVASGVYAWLPLGNRVVRKVAQIVREEMDAGGAQELWLPIIQPLELWE